MCTSFWKMSKFFHIFIDLISKEGMCKLHSWWNRCFLKGFLGVSRFISLSWLYYKLCSYYYMEWLIFEWVLTLSAGTAASFTNSVTIKKPWALSPPGKLTSSSRFLQGKARWLLHTTKPYHIISYFVLRTMIQLKAHLLHVLGPGSGDIISMKKKENRLHPTFV